MKLFKTLFVLFLIVLIIIIPIKTKLYTFTDINRILLLKDSFIEKSFFESLSIMMLIYIVFSLFFITTAPLSIFSGFLFGFSTGSIVSYIGTSVTMSGSFLWARYLFKSFFLQLLNKSKFLKSVMDKLHKHDRRFILLSRLLLITPYNSLNIICGISEIKFKTYIIASILGAIPQAFFYGYIGSIFNSLTSVNAIKKKAIMFSLIIIFFIIIISLIQRLINKKVA